MNMFVDLELRGLPPPEPLIQATSQMAMLEPGQVLRITLDREPYPLYEIAKEQGFRVRVKEFEPGQFHIHLWEDSSVPEDSIPGEAR
ncbi:MAG: sulfurtransferase TusA family protein [Gammaproteobacteria bacterium]|nr:MAG: sulfurtransferase TusA family protein [Gammaproteobacteria bacterium]